MKPSLIVAMIAGGATGITTNLIFDSGLRAPASPGSIVAVAIQTPAGSFIGVILSVILSATVSFLVASLILRASRKKDLAALESTGDRFGASVAQNAENKGGDSKVASLLGTDTATAVRIDTIVFACDAGMGSSAMGATILRKKFADAGLTDVTVTNVSIANLDETADLVITHQDLTARATEAAPQAQHISVENFMSSPKYDEVVSLVTSQRA